MTLFEFLDKYAIGIVIVMIILALVFICIGHIYRQQIQMAMKHEFVKFPATTVDWWTISHILFFAVAGFVIPGFHVTAFMVGALFEVIEDMLSSDRTTQLADCMTPDKNDKFMCWFSINDDYWYGKWDDALFNLLGYSIGSAIRGFVDSSEVKK